MKLVVTLLFNDKLYREILDDNKAIVFGKGKNQVAVEGFDSEQVIVKNHRGTVDIKSKKPFDFTLKDVPLRNKISLDSTKTVRASLYLAPYREEKTKISTTYTGIWSFGRGDNNQVILHYPFISKEHFVLRSESGIIRVEDLNSSNGLFLNGQRVSKAKLKSGDVLCCYDIAITLLNGELYIENDDPRKIEIKPSRTEDSSDRAKAKILRYHRSPRTRSMLPEDEIILSPPPSKPQKFQKTRGTGATSLVSSLAMTGASMAVSAVSPALLAARAASLIYPITGIAGSSANNSKRKKELEEQAKQRTIKYGAYIEEQKALIEVTAREQRNIITDENPSPQKCIEIINNLERKLWERMFSDSDFLNVRIGMGYEDLCVKVKSRNMGNSFQMETDEMEELTNQIVEETKIVDSVPFRLNITEHQTIGVVGNRRKTIQLIHNLLLEIATLHSFEDVKFIGVFDESEREIWENIKWFPHIWDDSRECRFLAFGERETKELSETVKEIIDSRNDSQNSYGKKECSKPYYVLICGSKELIQKEAVMHDLLSNNPTLGMTSLFLFDDKYLLPPECTYLVDLDEDSAYGRNEANKRKFFTLDKSIIDVVFDRIVRRMFAIELEGLASRSALPDGISFLDGFDVKKPDELNIAKRWQQNKPFKSLETPIGVLTSGKPMMLDLHEKVHGPHGLVAGTTGSGKSEMLITWILSMAVNFDPREVSFVIIDYKGGGLANRVEKLPHVVGTITNISSNINRYLSQISNEVKRREAILSNNKINDIIDYQKAYREGKVSSPLPLIFIVADEFAELKSDQPEFLKELVHVACVGRSLGIRMILATQKPGGIVDDQISSNTNLRLCMKVQTPTDSREMINRPDAARIRQTGRSYIRVGDDIYFDIFQSFWSGAPYLGDEKPEDIVEENEVRIVEMNGYRSNSVRKRRMAKANEVSQIDVVVNEILAVCTREGIKVPDGPLLPELPTYFSLAEIRTDETWYEKEDDENNISDDSDWLQIPIGLYDKPYLQEQGIQFLDIYKDGHVGIYGAPLTGKTTMLKTIVLSLAEKYSPRAVNIYILDFGGWSMNIFADMPQVGGVVLDCEEEKLNKFVKLITDEFEQRKKLFMKNGVSSLKSYRESISNELPAIIIAIDNFASIFDLYPDLENFFVTLSREGATYGIHMIYTSNSSTGVRYKILQNIKGGIAFEMTDKGDYQQIVGRLDSAVFPGVLGRAFIKNQPPIEFQSALYTEGVNEKERVSRLKEVFMVMNENWNGPHPKRIPLMPEVVTENDLLQAYNCRTLIPVGIDWEDIENCFIDLSERYSMLITGSIQAGKSALLNGIVRMVKTNFYESKLYVLDGMGEAQSGLKNIATGYCVDSDDAQATKIFEELINELNTRKRQQNEAKSGCDSFDEKAFAKNFELICIVIDNMKEFVDQISDENLKAMERISRLGQNLGVIILCAGRFSDISTYNQIESFTRGVVENQNGIVIGATPAQVSFFSCNLGFNEKNAEAGAGNAYVFLNGKCVKVKLKQ